MKSHIIFDDTTQKQNALNWRSLRNWITKTVSDEGYIIGDLSFVFCDDAYLHKINLEFLEHDTLTDIVTFDYSSENIVSGEIYISAERVEENANQFSQEFDLEIHRIIIHGVLHLLGYKDKTPKDKLLMTNKEDYYLSLPPISE